MIENTKFYKIKKVNKSKKLSINTILYILICLESIVLVGFAKGCVDKRKDHFETLKRIEASSNLDYASVYTRLQNAINNNKNIGEDEKTFIKSILFIFAENKDYLDVDYVEDALLNLRIVYVKNNEKAGKVISTRGSYDAFKNVITFYKAKSIEDVNPSVFTHELFHVMQKNHYRERNDYLIETINTIFNEENTERKESTLYSNYYNYTKMLIEILGVEPFRKYQGYTMNSTMVNALTEIWGSESDANYLINKLDEYKIVFDMVVDKGASATNSDLNKLRQIQNAIVYRLSIYYEAKYGREMDNDLIMLYYYDYDKFCKLLSEKLFINCEDAIVGERNELCYFKGEDPCLIVYAKGPIKTIELTIGNDESYHKSEVIDDKEIVYVINSENRYIDTQKMSLGK